MVWQRFRNNLTCWEMRSFLSRVRWRIETTRMLKWFHFEQLTVCKNGNFPASWMTLFMRRSVCTNHQLLSKHLSTLFSTWGSLLERFFSNQTLRLRETGSLFNMFLCQSKQQLLIVYRIENLQRTSTKSLFWLGLI